MKDVTISLKGRTENKVITLIGLNESGKTTVLEGVSLFPINDRAAASIYKSLPTAHIEASMIPIHETGVFSGDVSITGLIDLDATDVEGIFNFVKSQGYDVNTDKRMSSLYVTKAFSFLEGDYVPEKFSSSWSGLDIYIRPTKRGKYVKASVDNFKDEDGNGIWHKTVDYLRPKLPHVVYFPNFIVDTPRKIYISQFDGETTTNSYYRRIIEYALAESSGAPAMQTHVLNRISKFKNGQGPNWISALMGSDEKDKIDAVFSRLSGLLTEEVLGAWSRVFNRPASAIRIDARWNIDPQNEQPFVELRISDGMSSYHLHQRSLGFRWFFTFLLFTRFGRDRTRTNIFLFDEPAANLHAKAQAELLSSFSKLAEGGDTIMYSTHSHHMINPEWLSGAYIVENEAIDYDDVSSSVATRETSIKVTNYRRFVGENGNRVSYFQPVLERLSYSEPKIAAPGAQLLVEGISDFYAFSYARKRALPPQDISIVPGTGSGSLDTLISIALARGHKFLVLLDDDAEGRAAAERYKRLFFLSDDVVTTIGALSSEYSSCALERLLTDDTKEMIEDKYGNSKKSSVGHYLAEACATNRDGDLSDATITKLNDVLDLAIEKMALR